MQGRARARNPRGGNVLGVSMRRPLILAALAGTALVLWVAAPALSVKRFQPRAVDFEMALGATASARAAGAGAITTPVVRAPRRFDLLGFRWSSRWPQPCGCGCAAARPGAGG